MSCIFQTPTTKSFVATRTALGMENKSVVVAFAQDEFASARVIRNTQRTKNTLAENLNVVELLNSEYVLTSVAGIEALAKRFTAWEK